MVIDPARADEIEKIFRACYDLTVQSKDNNSSKTDLFKNLAKSLQVDAKIVKSAFAIWSDSEKKNIQDEGTELFDALQTAKPKSK